mmetsp:Transcript_32119/g.104318  ORF Transcript_32119/g.104318 Transcript_32119/m.104318 type:complete len:86 (-) Transcript_32119:556-813(-)
MSLMGLKSFLESIAQPSLRSQDDRVALCHRVRIERETAPFLKENVRLPAPRSPISSQRLAILSLDVHQQPGRKRQPCNSCQQSLA